MPRRDRRVVTYDFTSASTRAIFDEAEDDFEFDEEAFQSRGGAQKKNQLKERNARRAQGNPFGGQELARPLLLKEQSTPQRTADLINLMELFGQTIERDVVESVFAECGFQFEPALQVTDLSLQQLTLKVEHAKCMMIQIPDSWPFHCPCRH